MKKLDELQLWNAVLEQWNRVQDLPDDEHIVSAWRLGEKLGMNVKRIEYLSRKWHDQGKWVQLGTMTGTDIVSS
jgi:hypothetical protein